MNTQEFAELVREMRKHQKAYFKTKNSRLLQESKDYERRVDRALEELFDDQQRLFDDTSQ